MLEVPRVETERLVLRGHRLEDLPDCAAMWADERVTRHIGGRPFTREETWTKLLRNVGHWALLGHGLWVVEDKASGRFVGEVGMACFERDLSPTSAMNHDPELGWVLAPWAHGRGLASEAVQATLAWGRQRLGSRRVSCLIDPGNLASLRVAEKCGFVEEGHVDYHGEPAIVLARQL